MKKSDSLPHDRWTSKKWTLKNGAKPFNLRKVKKCGAKSKRTGKPCRQPAMKNGRCRFHGGKSTGPRTPEGKERARRGNWKHGFYSQEEKLLWRIIKARWKTANDFLAGLYKDEVNNHD